MEIIGLLCIVGVIWIIYDRIESRIKIDCIQNDVASMLDSILEAKNDSIKRHIGVVVEMGGIKRTIKEEMVLIKDVLDVLVSKYNPDGSPKEVKDITVVYEEYEPKEDKPVFEVTDTMVNDAVVAAKNAVEAKSDENESV